MSPKLQTQVTRCCTFQRSIATDRTKWRPLLYRYPSRQPRQAIAPAQYSNLKCVSQLSTTLYIYKQQGDKSLAQPGWRQANVSVRMA